MALIVSVPHLMADEPDSEDSVLSEDFAAKEKKTSAIRTELKAHFKFYGFFRDYFAYDSRESIAGTADLYYYMPKDNNYNEYGDDLNAQGTFRFLSITTRLGVDVMGYRVGRTEFGAKVETDFYYGLSGVTGTATIHLRSAYVTIGWKDLTMGAACEQKAAVKLTIGQALHPIASPHPHVTSFESGAPFNPYARSPLLMMDASLGNHFTISAAAILQQYAANVDGEVENSSTFDIIPEAYVALSYKTGGFLTKLAGSMINIKPSKTGIDVNGDIVKVNDRLTGYNAVLYLQYTKDKFEVKAKTIYSQAGDYMNMMSGYGISEKYDDGHCDYTPLQTSSSWASFSYGKKWQVMLMVGYIRNFGSVRELATNDPADIEFLSNDYKNLNSLWRVIPTIAYNVGKFTIAQEYNMTSARYGDGLTYNNYGLSSEGIHSVTNHRIQTMVRYTF